MLDSQLLRNFLFVCDTGSLTKASRLAHVTQPALSRSIQLLETELEVNLFERTGRGMKPTPEGLKLELKARPLLEQLESLRYEVRRDEITGPVTLAVTPSIGMHWVASIIEMFMRAYPGAQLRTAAVLSGAMGPSIAEGKYDLGLLYSPHTTAHLITEELWQEKTYFVSGTLRTPKTLKNQGGRTARTRRSIGLKEVLQSPLIAPSFESGIFALLELEARRLDLKFAPALIIDSVQLALEMTRQGKYGVILTERALDDTRAKGLQALEIVRPGLKRSAQLASTESALGRPVVRALFNHIKDKSESAHHKAGS